MQYKLIIILRTHTSRNFIQSIKSFKKLYNFDLTDKVKLKSKLNRLTG